MSSITRRQANALRMANAELRLRNDQLKEIQLQLERQAGELAASRLQLSIAAAAGGMALWDWELESNRLWLSSQWIEAPAESSIAMCGLLDLVALAHDEDYQRVEYAVRRLLDSKANLPRMCEQYRMMMGGQWRWVNLRGEVTERNAYGFPRRLSGTLMDVTDRKLAEEQAQADRDLLQSVLGHIPHAVFWKDTQRRYLGCNRKFAESLGLVSEKDVIGRVDGQLHASARRAEAIAASDHEIVETGKESIAQNQCIVLADGSRAEVLCSKVPLRSSNGVIFGMLGIFDDLTEQRKLERHMANARQLESLGRLAAGVAHEINTPMQFISDNIEFLSESTAQIFEVVDRVQEQIAHLQVDGSAAKAWQPTTAPKCLQFIREQFPKAIDDCLLGSRRVIEIVNAMKVFTHPGNGGFVCTNINDLLHSTVSITRNRWKYCAEVNLDLAELPVIHCVPSEINQVLVNLMVNAADAIADKQRSSPGMKGQILLVSRPTDNGVLIEVRDNGCGISQNNVTRIFDPFFTTKELGKGTGQGLTLCYGIICKKHGGSLTVQSEIGEGAVFRIGLPVSPTQVEAVTGPVESNPSVRSPIFED